jgi:hypothetical protein
MKTFVIIQIDQTKYTFRANNAAEAMDAMIHDGRHEWRECLPFEYSVKELKEDK